MKKIPVYELRKVQMVAPMAADGEAVNLQASTPAQVAGMLEALINGSGVEEIWVLALNARKVWTEWVESQRPRWKQEADWCIKAHGLVPYGDGVPR